MWAHPVSHVEQGMLLVAHPLMFTSSQEYFHQVCRSFRVGEFTPGVTHGKLLFF